ncbi:MAG: hypothetical protein KKF50_01920 [Nanoarchaeota archaeon]|nr:hypothetical protein [Nanoarchaeota archaeon]
MPGKNKPKRLDRNRSWRVARRKKERKLLINGKSRNRKPRPKHKGAIVETKPVAKKVVKKTVESAPTNMNPKSVRVAKKTEKKEE